jgi:putative transposase
MKVLRAYKTELDPTNVQRTQFVRCCGAARFCYNWGLAAMIAARQEGRKTSVLTEKKRLNAIKREEYPWLCELPYALVDAAFENLKAAYENFFRRVKAGQTPGFPRFKSRKRGLGGFSVRGSLVAEAGRIRLPVIGWVRLKERGYLPTDAGRIMSFTISERAHRWFVSALYEEECEEPEPATGEPIGVDFGIKELATCSDGTVFPNPRALESATRQVKRLSRELARRKKGGKNWGKTKAKLAKAHYRVACVRQHALHQISHHLTASTKPRAVVIEDLNVAGMLANHHIARAVSDVAFGELRRQITYKAAWNGVEVVFASQWFPSSKTCSECGAMRDDLTLRDRTFICPECGVMIDRDLNAALNLVALAA